jgi:hypothetical protein
MQYLKIFLQNHITSASTGDYVSICIMIGVFQCLKITQLHARITKFQNDCEYI